MTGNTYGNLWKYMVTHSKKEFKASNDCETHLHQSQITKSSLRLKNIKSLSKNQTNLKKMSKYYEISSKTEKWDLHFTEPEGAKILHLK